MQSNSCVVILYYILSLLIFDELKHSLALSVLLLVAIQIVILILHKLSKQKSPLLIALIEITLFLGFFHYYLQEKEHKELKERVEIYHLLKRKALFEGTVIDIPQISNGKSRIKVLLESFQLSKNDKQPIHAVVFFYNNKELKIHHHDTITFLSRLYEIKNFSLDFDYVRYCFRENVQYLVRVYSRKDIKNISHPPQRIFRFLDQKIAQLHEFLKNNDETGIIKATILGDKSDLDENINEAFKKTGTSHLIVISGSHIAFLFFFISLLITKLLFAFRTFSGSYSYKKSGYILTSIVLLMYLHLLNYPVPAARAFICIIVYIVTYLLDIHVSRLSIIFFSAWLILCVEPTALYGASFQLSFICVLAIELVGLPLITWMNNKKVKSLASQNKIQNITKKILTYYSDLLIISVCISICVLPLSLYYFHYINIFNPIYNMIAIPLFSVIIALSFCFSLLFFFLPLTLQYFFLNVIKAIIIFLSRVLDYCKDIVIAETPQFSYQYVVGCYIFFFIVALVGSLYKRRIIHNTKDE